TLAPAWILRPLIDCSMRSIQPRVMEWESDWPSVGPSWKDTGAVCGGRGTKGRERRSRSPFHASRSTRLLVSARRIRCLRDVGRNDNEDVRTPLHRRPRPVANAATPGQLSGADPGILGTRLARVSSAHPTEESFVPSSPSHGVTVQPDTKV